MVGEKVLLLRTCNHDGTSYNDFEWPLKVGSVVEAPDWNPKPECGGGLHGLLWGSGNGGLLNWSLNAKWLVIEANKSDVVEIDDEKAKCKKCKVVHVGDQKSATDYIFERCPNGPVVVGAKRIVGDSQSVVVGDFGTAKAGHCGTAIVGYYGTATTGDYGTAKAGHCGTAIVGYYGTATVGDYGTATAGYLGKAKAGIFGQIQIGWYDKRAVRHRTSTGYIGENGLKPNIFYKCDENGNFVAERKGQDDV